MNRLLRGEVEEDVTPPSEGLAGPQGEPEAIDSRGMNERLRDALRARRQHDHSGRTG
jgi:hypothetical protein